MGDQFYRSGKTSGFQYVNKKDSFQGKITNSEVNKKGKDDDLIIEENTVYEIDRECYERLNKMKKRF